MIKRLSGPRTHVCWTPDAVPPENRERVSLVRESDLAALEAARDAWREQAQQAASVIAMIRAMIGEMFGPVIESEDATLLRGPEAKHDGEAILAALQKIAERHAEPAGEAGPVACDHSVSRTEGEAICVTCGSLITAPPDASAIREALPVTGPYVDRLIRIFRDRPDDDTSAVVLQDYARAALAGAKPDDKA